MKKISITILICALGAITYLVLTGMLVSSGGNGNQGTDKAGEDARQNRKFASATEQAPGMASLQKQSIIVTNLPDHIQVIVEEYWHKPEWSIASKLTPADNQILLQLYRQEPSLVKKHSLTVALGLVGDEEVVRVFKRALSDEYAGRKLTAGTAEINEELVMNATVSAMGFLANRSDSAYELLKSGMDPKFWKDYCKFIPANDPRFYGTLANDSIRAIGWSGRPDVTNILKSLKPLPLVNDLDTSIMQMSFYGAVVDAAFANEIIAARGLDFYKLLYFNMDTRLQLMTEWKKQGNGLAWRQWRQQREGGVLAP